MKTKIRLKVHTPAKILATSMIDRRGGSSENYMAAACGKRAKSVSYADIFELSPRNKIRHWSKLSVSVRMTWGGVTPSSDT